MTNSLLPQNLETSQIYLNQVWLDERQHGLGVMIFWVIIR